jgi:NADH dehydrogenase/NADH:ubiquinone oxidoreductase subunit G
MSDVTLTVNGIEVRVPAGSSLLQAARAVGAHVPTLCYDSQLTASGACRMCVVEVKNPDGSTRLEPACSCQVQPGMVVRTNTRELREARRVIIELILANHPRACQTCIGVPRIPDRWHPLRRRETPQRAGHLVGGHHAPP